jgi:hypothetical protein
MKNQISEAALEAEALMYEAGPFCAGGVGWSYTVERDCVLVDLGNGWFVQVRVEEERAILDLGDRPSGGGVATMTVSDGPLRVAVVFATALDSMAVLADHLENS